MAKNRKTTTRSYTLGLLAPGDAPDWLPLWDRLFHTHYAVCRGTKEFGEFYLNLRGGLPASLADRDKDAPDSSDRLLQRGTRRVLALGWLSVEDDRGAAEHPYRVREVTAGQSLTAELAAHLLRDILTDKGVESAAEQSEWVADCLPALTARIRGDAVWVNRATAFAAWKRITGPHGSNMAQEACRILFNMCGSGFVSLALPDQDAAKREEESDVNDDTVESSDTEGVTAAAADVGEEVEPSNASRRVYGDLFGGEASEKLERAKGKDEFGLALRQFLERGDFSRGAVLAFRQERGLPELDTSRPEKYPAEVSSSGAPTAVAKRYRKLLVSLGIWPQSESENGVPRPAAAQKYGRHLSTSGAEDSPTQHINSLDLLDACPEAETGACDDLDENKGVARIYSPVWAPPLAHQVAEATGMPVDAKSLTELKRLMFALAARRVSQTQSWTKRNEFERQRAAIREDNALGKLLEIDSTGAARKWLTAYESRRHEQSGSSSDFRITKRMIGEAEAVFKTWAGTATPKERDEKTAIVQASAEKFGDARLYADLASEADAEVIWQSERGAELLKEWVKFRQAQFDQWRLKIPRFCHPDPFHHPTWCEFGGTSKPKIWYAWNLTSKPARPEPGGDGDGSRRLWIALPDFALQEARPVPMRWRCKRLSRDLGGVREVTEKPIPRADRLGMVAAELPPTSDDGKTIRYRPELPFRKDAKGWNARLQLDRDALEELEEQWDGEREAWRDGGKAVRGARWFVTFAPELAVSDGPGRAIHPRLAWKSNPHSDLNKKQKRQGRAQLILGRLPGLRLLSVDLGHRYAAACAVWEALSKTTFDELCAEARAKESQGWRVHVTGLYAVIQEPPQESNRFTKAVKEADSVKKFRPTKVFRRIGPDVLVDPKTKKHEPHPAPWARLERQFLIKLQGEEEGTREASNEEIFRVHELERQLGRAVPLIDRLVRGGWGTTDKQKARLDALQRLGHAPATANEVSDHEAVEETGASKDRLSVDELMTSVVRTAQLALRRHGDRARIALALAAKYKTMPGAQRYYFDEAKDASAKDDEEQRARNRIEFILDGLVSWHSLFSSRGWKDEAARRMWDDQIATLSRYAAPEEIPADATPTERKSKRQENRDRLRAAAEALAADGGRRCKLHEAWAKRWHEDDGVPAVVEKGHKLAEGTGWHRQLRELQNWLMPSGIRGKQMPARRMGGLSFTRLAALQEFRRKAQIGFFTRLRPDGTKWEAPAKFGKGALDALEHMREQRVKQLASRIVEAALGAGRMKRASDSGDRKRPRQRVDETCHAIVIENLANYRPDEMQTRRENRQLMSWSSSKVNKYLSEACQLHGLHLREVPAAYTSRQDSRTGAPGVRCSDVSAEEFMNAPRWRKQVKAAEKKRDEKDGGSERDRYLLALDKECEKIPKNQRKEMTLRIPAAGGELFVSADPSSPAARGLQADLNAAANIGLKALLDPDWSGAWWYVPACLNDKGKRVPAEKSCMGAACLEGWEVAKEEKTDPSADDPSVTASDRPAKAARTTKKGKKPTVAKEIVNLWRDPVSAEPGTFAFGDAWQEYAHYKRDVECRVIRELEAERKRRKQ